MADFKGPVVGDEYILIYASERLIVVAECNGALLKVIELEEEICVGTESRIVFYHEKSSDWVFQNEIKLYDFKVDAMVFNSEDQCMIIGKEIRILQKNYDGYWEMAGECYDVTREGEIQRIIFEKGVVVIQHKNSKNLIVLGHHDKIDCVDVMLKESQVFVLTTLIDGYMTVWQIEGECKRRRLFYSIKKIIKKQLKKKNCFFGSYKKNDYIIFLSEQGCHVLDVDFEGEINYRPGLLGFYEVKMKEMEICFSNRRERLKPICVCGFLCEEEMKIVVVDFWSLLKPHQNPIDVFSFALKKNENRRIKRMEENVKSIKVRNVEIEMPVEGLEGMIDYLLYKECLLFVAKRDKVCCYEIDKDLKFGIIEEYRLPFPVDAMEMKVLNEEIKFESERMEMSQPIIIYENKTRKSLPILHPKSLEN
ncbi:hypothetical protein O9G_000628, partial [Rozella allomycis CSF55]